MLMSSPSVLRWLSQMSPDDLCGRRFVDPIDGGKIATVSGYDPDGTYYVRGYGRVTLPQFAHIIVTRRLRVA